MSRRVPAVVGLVLVALLASGCGGSSTLDIAHAQTQLASRLAARLHTTVKGVQCPAKVVAKSGTSFECTAVVDGQRIRVRAVQAAGGQLRAEPLQAVIHTEEVAADATARLSQSSQRAISITCGPPAAKVLSPGQSFLCTANDGISTHQVRVRLRDAAGNLSYTFVDPSGATSQ